MLANSDRDIASVEDHFSRLGVEAGLLVPTQTGLNKSILDATETFRAFLKFTGVHDFSIQKQGQEQKKIVRAGFVTTENISWTKVSLYRPNTKNGDPRVCIYGLKSRVSAGNLLVCFVVDGDLLVLNASEPDLWRDAQSPNSFVDRTIHAANAGTRAVENELLRKFQEIAALGWYKTVCAGPTGVGATLEHLLGIKRNSSKSPDYKGTELKSGRRKKGKKGTLQTLFSKSPIWKSSPVRNAVALLKDHGYLEGGRRQLYCSVNASGTSNRMGFYLRVDEKEQRLVCARRRDGSEVDLLVWSLDDLRHSLLEKHRSTAWIGARHRGKGAEEEFFFESVEFTTAPAVAQLTDWINRDILIFDFTLHLKDNGKARDHGYLFRVHPTNMAQIFPSPKKYTLIVERKDIA